MKITAVETLACDAGWRNYHFVKVSTDAGVTGWSEYDEGFGSPGVTAVIAQLAGVIVGQSYAGPQRFTRTSTPAPGQQRAGRGRRHRRAGKRCSTPMPSAWACRATRCWAARCAMRCACTGRIVRHGASTIRSTMAPPSPTWPASRRRRPGASAASLHRKRTCSSTTKAVLRLAARVFLAVLARAERGRARDSQSARHAGSAAARRR